jgi:death-on-curing protein
VIRTTGRDRAAETEYVVLAAAYAYGIVRNHPFTDGNKRTGWVVARVFLAGNGNSLRFAPHDAVTRMEALSAEMLPELELANWLRQ